MGVLSSYFNNNTLNNQDKNSFATELFSKINAETKILLCCYYLKNYKDDSNNCIIDYTHFSFNEREIPNKLLLNILTKAATDSFINDSETEKIQNVEIETKDYSNEQFYETINRLANGDNLT